MVRFVVRLIALLVLAGGFAALIVDGVRSIAGGGVLVTSFGETCFQFFPRTFPLLQPAVERHLHPLVWDPVLLSVLLLPTFVVLTVLGVLLFWLARRREPPIGFSSRP